MDDDPRFRPGSTGDAGPLPGREYRDLNRPPSWHGRAAPSRDFPGELPSGASSATLSEESLETAAGTTGWTVPSVLIPLSLFVATVFTTLWAGAYTTRT